MSMNEPSPNTLRAPSSLEVPVQQPQQQPQQITKKKKAARWMWRQISIRNMFITFCTVLVILLSFAIWFTSYRYGEVTTDLLSHQVINETLSLAFEALTGFMESPAEAAQYTSKTYLYGTGLSLANLEVLRRHLWPVFKSTPIDLSVLLVLGSGDYVAYRTVDYETTLQLSSTTSVGLREYWSVDLETGSPKQLLRTEPYDPRSRPWYSEAKQRTAPGWGSIYERSGQLVVPYTIPFFTDNNEVLFMILADVTLDRLNEFLTSLKLSTHGKIVIIDSKGSLILVSGENAPVDPTTGWGKSQTYSDINNDNYIQASVVELNKSFAGLQNAEGSRSISFNYDGEKILVQASVYLSWQDLKWIVAVVVPERDFQEKVVGAKKIALAIFISTLVLSITIIAVLTTKITRPLLQLGNEMEQAATLENSESTISKHGSRFYEIKYLQRCFSRLKIGLQSFDKYVPQGVVRKLLAHNTEASLGLDNSNISIMFTDIQDFTTISEQLEVNTLGHMTAIYFEQMTDIINSNRGIVDKFIGDSIMAFWNASTDPVPSHPYLACDTALRCAGFLADQNKEWENAGLPQFISRIGIHTGPALVGNVGSSKRLNYTALGESVTLASRLEGMNKQLGTRVLISEDVFKIVKDKFLCRMLAPIKSNYPTNVYELITWEEQATVEQVFLVQVYEQGQELYQRKCYQEALYLLEEAVSSHPSVRNDLVTSLLVKECRNRLQHPVLQLPPK